MPTFEGESKNGAPILSAGFWKKGTKIIGSVIGVFDTSAGKCYNLTCKDELTVKGSLLSPKQEGLVKGFDWSIGALKGFEMAIRASGAGTLEVKDLVTIECTGTEATGKGNDRVNFKIRVDRPFSRKSDF